MKYGICSLYANPIHGGHITYLEESSALVDKLFVIVNNDDQVEQKGTVPFMGAEERCRIVSSLGCVEKAFISVSDTPDIVRDIKEVVDMVCVNDPDYHRIYFFNSGDVVSSNEDELRICREYSVIPVFLDLKKENSSSRLIERAQMLE